MDSRVGRNEPCPCGSGKKYNKCCMKAQEINENAKRNLKEKLIEFSGEIVFKTDLEEAKKIFLEVVENAVERRLKAGDFSYDVNKLREMLRI